MKSNMVLLPLIVLLQVFKDVLAGVLQPEVADSVLPYRNNENAVGKYTFTFKMSSPVPSNPRITVDFPSIYPKILNNVDACRGSVLVMLKNEKETFACQIVGRQVVFDISSKWSELDAGNIVVDLYDVVNPPGVQGQSTGYFQVRTWSGIDIVIDSNLAFDSIAFAPAYTLFSAASIVNDGANIAGYTTNYILTVQTAFTYLKGTWFRMKFPTGFEFAEPLECYITNIPVAVSNLPCHVEDGVIVMKNLLTNLAAGEYKFKLRNIVNPKIATTDTGYFLFESLREGVYTVIEYIENINGVVIKPGTVTDVTVIGFPLVQNLFVDYEIRYRPANEVPVGGMFNIQFPPDFSQSIDKTCRIVSGLRPQDATGIKCVTDGIRDIWISGFQHFIPQYITVKCFAYNPPVAGPTQHFQVRTFTDTTKTTIIDENVQAGFVVISSIDKPNFFKIDFYVKHVNCSFFFDCPMSFRYFTDPTRTLPKATSTTDFSVIAIQMPIWWLPMINGPYSSRPECLFGDVPTASCRHYYHVVSIVTPTTQEYTACELPFSVDNVRLTPIPGKFPFRIHTFYKGSKFHPHDSYTMGSYSVPIEQDTYVMDIPPTGIAVLQTWCSGYESEDVDNLLHLRSNVHPFLFAWSGSVSVIITHEEVSLEDKAEWPKYAGQPGITDNSYKELACKLYQSGAPTGYMAGWWDSIGLRCMMKTGDYSVKDPTIIQVTGFDSNIDKGNYYEMYIPDIKFCRTLNRQCKILYTYTMTEDYKYPYRISQREQSLAKVLPAEVPANVQPAKPAIGTAYGQASRTSNVICNTMNLLVDMRFPQTVYPNDYIVIKRHIDHWYHPFIELRNNNHPIRIQNNGINYLDSTHHVMYYEKNQQYFIHRVMTTVPAHASNYRITIENLIVSPYPDNEAHIEIVMWSNHKKMVKGSLIPTAKTSTNQGLFIDDIKWEDVYGGLPRIHRDFWRPYQFRVRICQGIPPTGEMIISYRPTASPTTATTPWKFDPQVCRVWRGLQKQKANETHVSCTYDKPNNRWVIKDFDFVPKRTYVRINWWIEQAVSVSANDYAVATFNVSGVSTTRTDFNGVAYPTYVTQAAYSGDVKALSWEYRGHYEYKWELYQGSRGKFVFEIETGDNMQWEPTENQYFVFTTHFTVVHNADNLECRYAEKISATAFGHHFPSVACWAVTNALTTTITMKLHPNLKIVSNQRYQIFIDTRAVDLLDGLSFTRYGVYSINVESFIGGVKQKGGKQRFEVFGPRIPHFAVWSSNKLVNERAFYTYYCDFFNNQAFATSDSTATTFTSIMLYFATEGAGGYPYDLGMGFPDQSNIPCNLLVGITLLPNVKTAICTLYYGYSDAPARIKVEGYRNFNTRIFRVDIPVVTNPATPGVVPRTWLKILQTTVAAGVKTIEVLWEGRYYELNTTWTRNATMYPYDEQTYGNLVSFSVTGQNLPGVVTIGFRTPQTLHGNDFVLIQFPKWWPTPFTIDPTTCAGFPLLQERCYSIRNDAQDTHYVYFQISGALANNANLRFEVLGARSKVPPNATATHPLNYFHQFVYHDTRLIRKNTLNNLNLAMFVHDPIVPTINCLPTNPVQTTETEYIVTFNLPHDLLGKSEIRIDYQDYDHTANPNCTSTTNSQLTGKVSCGILLVPDKFVSVIDFDPILANKKVEIKIPLLNRLATGANRKWRVRTYYLREGYYYMSGDSGLIDHAANCRVVAAAVATNVPWPTWFHKFARTRTSEYGPLVFIYESAFTLTKSTIGDYVQIKIPVDFQFAKAQKAASWDFHYPYLWDFQTTATHHVIRVWAPKTLDIEANKRYQLNITTLNALLDVNGLLYPPQSGSPYLATVEVFKANVLVEQGEAKVFVFQQNFPAKFMAKSYLMNSNQRASFRLTFAVPAAYTYAAGNSPVLKFRLPTATYKHRQRVNLFADDGGTGLASGDAINCHLFPDSTKSPLATTCKFFKGSQDLGIPASVEMSLVGSLTANTVYSAVFDGFRHPTIGADDKNVEPAVEFFTPAGALTYTGVDYDYTIVEDASPTVVNGFFAPTFDSLVIGQTGISMFIRFRSPVVLSKYQPANGLGWADYIIIEFPVGYAVKYYTSTTAKLTAGTGFAASLDAKVEFSCGNNWIIWRVDITTLAANTDYTLKVTGIDQAIFLPPNPAFKILVVSNRELVSVINHLPVAGLTAPAILATEMSLVAEQITGVNPIPKSKYQRYLLTFGHAIGTVPKGAAIQVVLPAAMTGTDSHCYNAAGSQLKNPATSDITVFCRWEALTNSYVITNIEASPNTETFKLAFYAISGPTATASNVVVKVFKDESRVYQIMEGTDSVPAVNAAVNGFAHLMFNKRQDELPDVVRAGESAPFTFELTIPASYSTATAITVTFGPGVSLPANTYLECFFGDTEARECVATSTAPLTVSILAPHSPALTAGQTFEVSIRTRCGATGQTGVVFPAAGTHSFTVSDGTSTSQLSYQVFAPNFDYIQPRVLFSNKDFSNGIVFRFRNNLAVPASGKIRVRFPKTSPSGRHQIWSAGPAADVQLDNKCVPTLGLTPTNGLLGCVFKQGPNEAIYELSGFNLVPATSDVEFVINDVTNPSTTTDYLHIDAILETVDGSGVPLNQGVAFDLFSVVSPAVVPASTGGMTITRTSNVLGAAGVSWTFGGMNPAGLQLTVNDQVVFVFPKRYSFPSNPGHCGGVAGAYRGYGKYVIFKPSATSNPTFTFCFNGVTNPLSTGTEAVLVYLVKSRSFTIYYSLNEPGYTAATATLSATISSLNRDAGSKYSFTVDTAATVPSGGSVVAKFPAGAIVQAIVPVSGFSASSKASIESSTNAILTTPTVYSKGANGLLRFDVYVKNPPTGATVTLELYGLYQGTTAGRMTTGTVPAAIAATAALANCFLDPDTSYAVAPSASDSFTVRHGGGTIAAAFTASASPGYDMLSAASGAAGCNGVPVYVTAASALVGASIDLLHVTTHQANLRNAVTVSGSVPAGLPFKTTGTIAVDFGNHDSASLGLGFVDGSFVPCHLETAGAVVEAECTLRLGTFFASPGFQMKFFADIPAGTPIKAVFAPFFNPTTARTLEVRFRYFEAQAGHRQLDLVSNLQVFAIKAPAVALSLTAVVVVHSTTTPAAQGTLTSTFTVTDLLKTGGFFYPTKMSNVKTYSSPASPNLAAVATGFFRVDSLSALEVLSNIEVGSAGYGASAPFLVVVDPVTKEATALRSFTSYSISSCALTGLSLTALTKNDVSGNSRYRVAFTTPCDLTRGSTIKIKIANYLSAISVNEVKLVSGTVAGSFLATSGGTTVDIYNYDYVVAGQSLVFEVAVNAVYTAAATDASDVSVHLRNLGVIATATSTCTRLTSTTSFTAARYVAFVRNNKPVTINGNGYLSLFFRTVLDIAIGTDRLELTQATAAFANANFYLRCKFTDVSARDETFLSKYCYYDATNKKFVIEMPHVQTMTNTKLYRLDIFYVGEQLFGFRYPAAANDVEFTVAMIRPATVREQFVTTFQVFKNLPTSFCFRNFVSNVGLKNVFMLRFKPAAAISGFLEFEFPNTVVSQGATQNSFSPTLGLTLFNAQAIECYAFTVAGSTKTASAIATRCVLDYGGSNSLDRVAKVKVVLAGSLAAGTEYQFDIYGINNPTTTNILSYVRMVAGNGAVRDYEHIYTDNFHLYTVTTTATVETAQTLPTLSPTTIQDTTNINLLVSTAPASTLKTNIGHIRLIYNPDMNKAAMSATGFETFDVDPGLAYYYNNGADKTTNFNLPLIGMQTPDSAETFVSAFKAQVIRQKVVASEITYNTGANTFVAIPYTSVTVPAGYKSVKTNDKFSMVATITLSKILSKTGSISLYVKNMNSVDATCSEASAIIGITFKCEAVSATELKISGFPTNLPIGTAISINFRTTTSSLTTGQVCARGFNDNPVLPTAAIEIVQLETCDTLTYTGQPGIVWFEARTPTRIRRIQALETGMMTFPLTLPVTVPKMTSTIKVLDLDGNFGNIITKDFECFFSNKLEYVAKSCVYLASTKTWEVKAPRTTDLTGPVTLTITSARQFIEFARPDGVVMPIAGGSYRCELEIYNAANALLHKAPELNVNLPVPHFTLSYFNSYLVMRDAFSTFQLRVRPQAQVNAFPNGVIKIDFKVKNRYGLDVFNPNLGTGILNGDVYDCPSASGGFVSKCRLFLGNAATPASILVDPQSNMLTTTTYAIDFPALLNPMLNMTEVLVEVTSQNLVAGTWVGRNTEHIDVFVAQEILVTPKPRPMLTWVPNTTGAPSAVTFSFTMDPAYGAIKSSTTSFDRIVIKVNKEILDILNDQAAAGKLLTCAGYTIKIFDSKDMIELSTAAGIAAGSAVNIACTNFFNQQYVIRGGLIHYVELWIDGTVADKFEYAANTVTPHTVISKSVAISAITPEISSFDTYTFRVKPFNYMPPGARFEIFFDQAFTTLTNCEIVSGLNGGICQIVQDSAGFDRIKISKFQLWNPDVDPEIRITIDMTSPPTAGAIDFNFVSYWQENTVDPTLEDKIDEDVLGTINYLGFVKFPYLKLDKMYQFAGERCPVREWEGVVEFKVRFVENLVYPHYLRIQDFRFSTYEWEERYDQDPFIIAEMLCYFDRDDILFSAKSERCYFNAGTLNIMIPEELPLDNTNDYVIKIESRGQRDRGLSSTTEPEFRWPCYADGLYFNIATPTTSSAPIFCKERACFFGRRDYTSTNWHQNYKYSLEIQDSTGINYFNMGGERINSRFQVQFSSHNEIKEVSQKHLGWDLLTTVNATDNVPCIYWHHDTTLNNPNIKGAFEMICQVHNVEPSYADYLSKYVVVTMYNVTSSNYGNFNFRYGFAGITNHQVTPMKAPGYPDHVDGNRNTFAHIIVQSQTEFEDGTWIDRNRVVRWYHIGQILPALVESTVTLATLPPTTNYITFGILHLNYVYYVTPEITLGGRVWVYVEHEHPYEFLSRNRTHGSRYCRIYNDNTDIYCMQYSVPFRWALWLANGVTSGTQMQLRHFGLMESPGFALTDASKPPVTDVLHDKKIKVYFASGNQVRRIKLGDIYNYATEPYYIFETDDAHNKADIWMTYRVGIWSVNTYENSTNLVRLWISNEFPDIGPDCKILFGFTRQDPNKLAPTDGPKCNIIKNDPTTMYGLTGQYHRVEFYNLFRWSRRWFDQYESWMVFEIRLKNPPTDKWPKHSNFMGFANNQVWPVINESRFNYLIWENPNQARVWVGNATTKLAHYFRVVRNRKTFEQRRQKAGEWAELHMRLWPKNVYPPSISKVEIQIPQSYDIPNGGNKICEVGHDYHTDLTGQFCEISNERKIQVNTNPSFGLLDRCTIVRVTTEKSVKNRNGFQAPATTAVEDFQTNLYIGTKRIEYSEAIGTPEPSKLVASTTLNITANIIEITKETTLNVSFHAARAVRAGYDSDEKVTDVFKKIPQGVIYLKFNTYDTYTSTRLGFGLSLGYIAPYNPGGGVEFDVPCQAFKNLIPREGQNIKCRVYPQPTSNYYNPVILKVTNFELIPENQQSIEFHVLKLGWIQDVLNQGWIEFSIYEIAGDGTPEKTYDDVRIGLGALANLGVALVTRPSAHALNPVLLPALVGSRIELNVLFDLTAPLFQYDVIEVTFPTMMILPNQADVSAVFYVVRGAVNYYVSCEVVIYPEINRVNFIIPRSLSIYGCTTTSTCTVTIKTAGFRHVPYELPAPTLLQFDLRVINKKQIIQYFRYNQVAPPVRSKFNSILVTMSSQFSSDIYVTYDFNFSPSYLYPSGSLIVITMDWTKYRHIDKSNPPATCQTNFPDITQSCIITEAKITVTLNGTLVEGFSAVITAKGVKNPTFEGATSNTDIKITSVHPTGNPINEDFTNTLVYKPQKNVDTISFKIELSSYYSDVSSDYKFTLQPTNTLPPKGILNIELPQEWSKKLKSDVTVSTISGGFTKQKLIYQQKAIRQPSETILLQIIPEFEWPSKEKLVIALDTIINPSGVTQTDPIKIYTQYDSVTIDRSDYDDPASVLYLKVYDPKIRVWKVDFTPQNEGEIAKYNIRLSCMVDISKGQKIQFVFSANYADILTVFPLSLKCSSSNYQIGACSATNRALTIPLSQDVKADDQMDFTIEGIANPNYGTINFIDIAVLDAAGNVVQFINDAFSIDSIQGATYTPLVKVSTLKNQILIKSDYQQCMQVAGNIPSGASVLLDFPRQFDIRKDSYGCMLGDGHDSSVLAYPSSVLSCKVYPHLKRIEIFGQTNVYTHAGAAKKICYKIQDLENAKDTGESFNFNMRIFDTKSKKILYKTAGILNYPSTLQYERKGLRIFVDDIPNIPLGTMSNDVKVTLENPVPYDITLTPSCPGIEFIPAKIVFKFYEGPTQKFRINPDKTVALPGTYAISWVKEEATTGAVRFSEMTDTYFKVTAQPDFRELKLTISQNVYRASIGAESMPIYVYLSHPASTSLTVFYKTNKPFQPDSVKFTPESITFEPGEKVKVFTYKTTKGAVSGLIDLQLQPEFRDIYYMPTPQINFEIEDLDNKPPTIEEYKLTNLRMKSAGLRVSCDESARVYYICSIKGTTTPSPEELMSKEVRSKSTSRPRTPEIQGEEYSTITSQTRSYIYYDTYLELEGLNSDTNYVLFMMPVDLSGNKGTIKKFEFKTLTAPSPVTFRLKAGSLIDDNSLLQALSLVSGITTDKFAITYRPAFSDIPTDEKEVTDVLDSKSMEYEVMILPDVTIDGLTPYDYVKKIETEKETLFTELPQLVQSQIIDETGREVTFEKQKFTYKPKLVEVSNFHALFNASIFYTGAVYGVVLPANEAQPSAVQVKDGLTSVNKQVLDKYCAKKQIEVNTDKDYRIHPSGLLNFTFLYHSSNYVAYFIGERATLGDPVLMGDDEVIAVPFKTEREIFKVDDTVIELNNEALVMLFSRKLLFALILIYSVIFN